MVDWPQCRIRDLGAVFDGPHATPKTVEEGPLFLGIGSLVDGRIDLSTTRHVTEEDFAKWTKRVTPQPDDFVFSYETRIGEAALIPKDLRCCLGRRMGLIRLDKKRVDPRFFLYAYLSPQYQEFLRRQTVHGATVDRLLLTEMPEFLFPCPDIAEQTAIGTILGALDDKIELNRRMNETLEELARAIFKSWFVDFDPVHAKAEGRDTGLAPDLAALFPDRFGDNGLPEGWDTAPLLDLANWDNGAAYKNMHFSDESDALPVVKIAELKAGVTGQTKRTNTQLGDRYRIDNGELLFSWSGNPETSIDAFVWVGGSAWLNQHIFAVRENGCRSKAYLHTALRFLKPEFTRIAANKQTTGLGHVTKGDMQRLFLPEPLPELLTAFDQIVLLIFERFRVALEESRNLAALRDLLLPKLMSGEIRIRDAEKLAGEAGA